MADLFNRLVIRNRADDGDLLVLSSYEGDTNCLLTEEPNADGQRIDWAEGTQEIGVVVWRAWDRDDGGDTRTITAQLADADARNQMLSNRGIWYASPDGSAWTQRHAGYLNSIKLATAGEFEFTVGDTNRKEQSAELFKFLTSTFGRGSCLIGGPILARTPTVYGGAPQVSFAGVKDYGPVRMQKVAATAGALTIAFEIVSGYVRPYYTVLAGAVGADEVETINRLARPWAVSVLGTTAYTASPGARRAWMDFPGLICRLRRVSDGVTFDVRPVAAPTVGPTGDIDRLVNGTAMGLYVLWPAVLPTPANGTQFDVTVFPNEISENAPLHWAGNPVDLVTLAWTQEGIPYNAAAAAAVRSVLSTLWVEYVFTGPVALKELVAEKVFAPYGVAARVNAAGEQVMFLTRDTIPDSVDTVGVNEIVTDE